MIHTDINNQNEGKFSEKANVGIIEQSKMSETKINAAATNSNLAPLEVSTAAGFEDIGWISSSRNAEYSSPEEIEDYALSSVEKFDDDWKNMHESIPSRMNLTRERNKKSYFIDEEADEDSRQPSDDDERVHEDSDSFLVLSTLYVAEFLTVKYPDKNDAKGIKSYYSIAWRGIGFLSFSMLLSVFQIALLLRLAAYYNDTFVGASGGRWNDRYELNDVSGNPINCGATTSDSQMCANGYQFANAFTQGAICSTLIGTNIVKGITVPTFSSLVNSTFGNACVSCLYYFELLTKESPSYSPSSVFDGGAEQYCAGYVCGPIKVWNPLDLFGTPIVLLAIIASVSQNMRDIFLAQEVGKNISHKSYDTILGSALASAVKVLLYLQAEVVDPLVLLVSVQLVLISDDCFTMTSNAVIIVFLVDIDNIIMKTFFTSSAVRKLLEKRLVINTDDKTAKVITQRKMVTFTFNMAWTNIFLLITVLYPCSFFTESNIQVFVVLFSLFGTMLPEAFSLRSAKNVVDGEMALPFATSKIFTDMWQSAIFPVLTMNLSINLSDVRTRQLYNGPFMIKMISFSLVIYFIGQLSGLAICFINDYWAILRGKTNFNLQAAMEVNISILTALAGMVFNYGLQYHYSTPSPLFGYNMEKVILNGMDTYFSYPTASGFIFTFSIWIVGQVGLFIYRWKISTHSVLPFLFVLYYMIIAWLMIRFSPDKISSGLLNN